MSQRTLIEINHDFWHRIEENPEVFTKELLRIVREGTQSYPVSGITYHGVRHHSEPFKIQWGHCESKSP